MKPNSRERTLTLLALCLTLSICIRLQQRNALVENRISALELELRTLHEASLHPPNTTLSRPPSVLPPEMPSHKVQPASEPHSVAQSESNDSGPYDVFGMTMAQYQIAAMSEHVALTEDEKVRLKDIFEKQINGLFKTGGASSTRALNEDLKAFLGEERFTQYQEASHVWERSAERQQREAHIAVLSRKLALSPEQETKVMRALEDAQSRAKAQLKSDPQISELRATPTGSESQSGIDAAKALQHGLRMGHQLETTRNALFVESLTGVLSDEQLNKLVEYQAQQAAEPTVVSPW